MNADDRKWQRQSATYRLTVERQARDEAIERAYKAANERWREDCYDAIHWCAVRFEEFIQEDVWDRLAQVTDFEPREKRAMGGVLRGCPGRGWIVNTGRLRQSPRPGCHLNWRAIWRSLIYQAEPSQQELRL